MYESSTNASGVYNDRRIFCNRSRIGHHFCLVRVVWYLYIVECRDHSLYTGITKDVDRRVSEHNTSKRGAKYTRSRRPVRLVCKYEVGESRSTAMKEERRIKKLSRAQKLLLIEQKSV